MTDTLQFKNNVGEVYSANVVFGNVGLTENIYETTRQLFNEKTKADNSSKFFEFVGVCGDIYRPIKKKVLTILLEKT